MTKTQFSQALALYTRALTSGTFAARIATKDTILNEHARLVDGIAEIMRRHRHGETIGYGQLADLLQSDPVLKDIDNPHSHGSFGLSFSLEDPPHYHPSSNAMPVRFGSGVDVTILGEESGFTDGVPEPVALRWLPGDSKPTRPGIYPTKITLTEKGKPVEKEGRSYWTGEYWGIQRDNLQLVKTEGEVERSAYQRKTWQDRSALRPVGGRKVSKINDQFFTVTYTFGRFIEPTPEAKDAMRKIHEVYKSLEAERKLIAQWSGNLVLYGMNSKLDNPNIDGAAQERCFNDAKVAFEFATYVSSWFSRGTGGEIGLSIKMRGDLAKRASI